MYSTSRATIGERSNIPSGGMMRRKKARNHSVLWWTKSQNARDQRPAARSAGTSRIR
jgi:hypothetical protein